MKKIFYTVACLATIVLFTAPDLLLLNSELLKPLPPHWDAANMQLWQYASMNGELIFKDFWFPYTESIRLIENNLSGWLTLFTYKIILFLLFSVLIYELFDSKLFSLILFLFILLGSELSLTSFPLFWGIDRYLLSISLVISFAITKNKFNLMGVILFTLGIFTYQDQLIISVIPILYIFFINLLDFKFNLRKFLKTRIDLVFIIAITCIYICKLFHYDQLSGFIYFYENYGSMYSYAFAPESVIENLKNISNFDFIYIFIPIITFLCVYNGKHESREALVCQSLAILTFFVTLKFLMRFTATQPLVFTLLCTVFIAKYYLASWKYYSYILGAVLALIIFSYGNSYLQVFKSLKNGLSRIENSIEFILSDQIVNEEFKITNRSKPTRLP